MSLYSRWFIHFYALGFVWNIALLTMFIQNIIDKRTTYSGMLGIARNVITASSSEMDCFSVLLTLVLLKIQQFRRLYESLFVSSFSGKMHIGHYAIGYVFYFMVNITVLAEIPHARAKGNQLEHKHALLQQNTVCMRTYFFILKSSFLNSRLVPHMFKSFLPRNNMVAFSWNIFILLGKLPSIPVSYHTWQTCILDG